ncbi:hypothetical protein GJ496_010511 [Pomphorhynchus laevis]|nr:hypothetical protein GJ496_010511 [Pomphorhynchus laevis]
MIPQAKAVAADVATLVMQARQLVISSPSDIIPAATRCTLYASQLVAVVKASELVKCSKRSRDLVLKCIDRLDIAVEEMANICCQLDREAYTCVKDTLALLKEVINQNQYQSDPLSCDAQSSLQILLTSIENTLLASSSDQPLVRIHANDTNEATNNLLCVVKQQLDQYRESAGLQQNLLKSDYDALINASIQFKNATNAFNGILSDNDDLIFACDNLSAASVRAANWSLSRPVLREADKCINEAINAAIQVVAAANAWHPDIQGEIIHKNIILLNEIVPELIAALVHSDQIDSLPQRIHLVFIADDFHTRCTSLLCDIVHFNTTINSITDQFAIGRLWSSLDDLKLVLSELQIQIHRIAELYCPSFSTDLLRTIRALNRDLDLNEFYSIPKTQSITCKVDQYTLCFRFVVSSISNICNVSISKRSSGNVLARNCKQLCQHLVDLVRVVRRLTIPVSNYGEEEFHIDVKSRNFLIQNTKSLLEISFLLLCAVGNLLSWNESALTLRNRFQFCNNTPVELFKETENKVIQIFQESLSVLPCFVEISDASRQLSDSANRILAQRLPLISLPSILPYNNCVVLLCEINHHINSVCYSALSVCLGLRLGVNCLVRAIKEFVQSFEMLMEFAMKFVVYLASQVSVRKYLLLLRKIHNAAVFFVETAQRHSFSLLDENGNDDNDFIANQQSSHRQLVRKLCELTFMILSVAPGRSLYDYTTSRLRYARELSFKIVSPVNNMNLVESNGQLIQHSKELGEFVSKIAQAAKNKQPVVESVSECIQTAASAALGLVESSTQAAYLIAISPNQSGQPEGQPSVFDQVVFVKSREAIIAALHAFTDPSNSQFEAHLTTAVEFSIILSNAARDAACRVNANEAASSYFLQRSQEIATELCDLVQLSLRDANNWLNSETREHVQRLELVVEAIFMYATSKKFCVIPSPITLQGREAQRPIVVSICQVIDGTIGLIESLHDLSDGSQQDDRTSWQQLSNHTHNISDGIKSLIVGIRGSVPGDQVCQFALNQLRQLINITQGSSHISCSTELTNIDFDRRKDTMSQYVDAMIYDTMCLGDLLEQISSSSKTLSNTSDLSEEGIIGHLISQFVIAEESLLHNVLCLAKIEMMPRSQILINKAIDSSEMAFKFISTVKEHFAFNNSSNMNDQIVKYKERCREINDELLSDIIKIADNCFSTKGNLKKSQKENKSNAPRTSTPINSVEYCQTNITTTTPKLSTERVTFPLEVEQPNSHDPLINTNVYDTARSLIENTRSLVLRCSVPAEASQPVMDAIERLTAILSLEDESKNVSDQEPLLKAVRDVSDALSTLIKDVGSRSELLSTSDLDLLKQATQTSILHRG